jgi:hypothetical protein
VVMSPIPITSQFSMRTIILRDGFSVGLSVSDPKSSNFSPRPNV